MTKREDMIKALGRADAEMTRTGAKAAWFDGVDQDTLKIAGESNGDLMSQLIQVSGYRNEKAAELLRAGIHFLCRVSVCMKICES